jgi:superfamily II DNA or RNA helicase
VNRQTEQDDPAFRIKELEEENARLRGLLGLDDRSPDAHRFAWNPTLLSRASELVKVDASSSDDMKVALLRMLFGARSDVFAVRWENKSTGRSGWSPAVRGGWSRSRGRKDYLPLTDEVLLAHVRGEQTLGIYPLLADDSCMLLACDFDKGTWLLDALAYLDVCHSQEVPAVLERSQSGDGGHVWVFFDSPVPAAEARAMGTGLLRQAMTRRAELDLASYDRFFPSQDFMPRAGFGNLIALPLQGERARQGTTVFLDPTTLDPWPDQWALLSSVSRLTPDAVSSLAQSLRPVAAGPEVTFAELAKMDGPAPPKVITARLGAMLSIERAGLPPPVVAALKHLGSISNPEFFEKQRMRFSTWNTPRFIRCYREDLEWIHLPRGLTERVAELIVELGSALDLTDDRADPTPLDLDFTGSLRGPQDAAVADLVQHERGVLVAPPGSGKTVIACAVIAHHSVPTLVIVDRKELVDQWRSRLGEYLELPPEKVGQIGGGVDQPTGRVDVAMTQSLARRDDPSVFDSYGLVVVDECHHIPAVSFAATVEKARSRRWLGLTATPYRRDKLEGIIWLQCGPTRHEISLDSVEGTALLRRDLIVHRTETELIEEDATKIHEVFAALVEDKKRTSQICRDVHRALQAGRTSLILTQRVSHIEAIVDELEQLGEQPLVLKGGMGKRARAEVANALSKREQDHGIVLVATGSYIGEGFDWPDLDTLFLAFPVAFKGRVVQYVGRLLRSHEGKHHVELHDYVDERIPVLERMHIKRLRAYRTLGFDHLPAGTGRRASRST